MTFGDDHWKLSLKLIIEIDQDDHWDDHWDGPVFRMTKSTFFDEIRSSDNFCIRQLKAKSFSNVKLILSTLYRGKKWDVALKVTSSFDQLVLKASQFTTMIQWIMP